MGSFKKIALLGVSLDHLRPMRRLLSRIYRKVDWEVRFSGS
jgi:hypothetical protein